MISAVAGSGPDRVRIFDKKFLLETRKDGGVEPQFAVSVPNIPQLNPESSRGAYDVKAYV